MTRAAKVSPSDAFAAAVTAPDPRSILKIDRMLADMDPATAETVTAALSDRSVSVARIVAGFRALEQSISASSVDIWRRRHDV